MNELRSAAAEREMQLRAMPGDHTVRRRRALKAGAGRAVRPRGRIITDPLQRTAEDTAGVLQLQVHPHGRITTVAGSGRVIKLRARPRDRSATQ